MTPTSEDSSKQDYLKIVRGFPFPPFESRQTIEAALDYKPKDEDLIVAGYPKTGTTWLQYIVMQILSKATDWQSLNDTMHNNLEHMGVPEEKAPSGQRWYKTHLPYNLVQNDEGAKFIYTYRHPEDTLVSLYHFHRELLPVPLGFDRFFDCFVSGAIWYGSYFNHLMSFYDHCGDPNILMVSYEKMHEDRKGTVLNIAKFIGEDHHAYLVQHQDVLEKIIERTSFDYMKDNLTLERKICVSSDGTKTINFFRKGCVGTGKTELSEHQRQVLKKASEILEGTTIYYEWYAKEN